MKIIAYLLYPYLLLLISLSALHGQEGKISKYSLAIYGGGFRPEKVNFTGGTRLENNRRFLLGTGIYNHPSERFDVFLRSELIIQFADIVPTLCNCPDRAWLKSNSTIETGVLYNFFQNKRSEIGIGISAGITYDIVNNNTIGYSTFPISEIEELTIFVRRSSTLGYLLSPQIQYNFRTRKKLHIFSSLGFVLTENNAPTVVYLEKRFFPSSETETIDFGVLRNSYAFFKMGFLYDFSVIWLKD